MNLYKHLYFLDQWFYLFVWFSACKIAILTYSGARFWVDILG